MSVRILVGHEAGCDGTKACLFCSASGHAFGPLLDDYDEAERFLEHHMHRYGDPREATIELLQDRLEAWRNEQ